MAWSSAIIFVSGSLYEIMNKVGMCGKSVSSVMSQPFSPLYC